MSGGARGDGAYGIGALVGFHLLAAVAVVVFLLPGLRDGPLSRDEAVYQGVERRVRPWLRELLTDPSAASSDEGVRRGWEFNHEHPAMARFLAAGPNLLLGGRVDPLVALRFGNALLAILLVFDAFHFLRRRYGVAAAGFGAMSLLLLPALYGHACIGSMDFPVAAFSWLATTAFVRGTERAASAVVFGVWMGCALNCKINAAFTPIPLLLWGFWDRRRACAPNLFALIVVAPLVWFATWPWLWHHTFDRLIEYLQFHREHLQANAIYFGEIYTRNGGENPPPSYALLYLLVSIPAGILLPAAFAIVAGTADMVRRRGRSETGLLVVALLVPICVATMPGVPRYDGSRLFLNAFPFVAALAGVGFSRGLAPLVRRVLPSVPRVATVAAAALFLWPTFLSLWSVHPFEAYSYYNVLTRGPSGAIEIGLSPMMFAMSDRSVAEYLNGHAEPGETIFAGTGASEPLRAYQRLGLLKRDLRWGRRADWVVLEYNLAYSNWPDWWPCYRNRHPWYRKVYEVKVSGAPVLGVFRARDSVWREPSGDVPRTTLKPPDRPGSKRFEMGAPPG